MWFSTAIPPDTFVRRMCVRVNAQGFELFGGAAIGAIVWQSGVLCFCMGGDGADLLALG